LRTQGVVDMPMSGIHSVTIPGAVAGWSALHARFGRLPLTEVLAPAIFYAERGFPVTDIIAARWATWIDKLTATADAARTYLPAGRAPKAGEIFTNRDLAASLRRIAAAGRAGFYEGATADAIVALSDAHGGTIAAADLREYEAEWVDPIATSYRGWDVYELPPNTQGIAALLMLNLMEEFPLGDYGLLSARSLHVMIEAKKLAYADMLRYAADPKFGAAPLEILLSKTHARARARLVASDRAAARVEPSVFAGVTDRAGSDTIYLSAIDRDGHIVSLIQSIYQGFGSGLVPRGAGFALHNRAGLFTLDASHPNVLAPRKRPLHTIIPGFMRRGATRIGFGIMGAWNQAQAHAQFVSNVVDHGLDIQEALEAGRFTKATFDGADVSIEALVPESVRGELSALGHDVTVVEPRTGTFGSGQAVQSEDATGVHFGASEPRHDGAAIPEAPPIVNKSSGDHESR
jgi:gamma-glutamyltranspeptidase/glutathione hydrolase